jgi:asparagine synthetase B (glutamine-hydrolysing)
MCGIAGWIDYGRNLEAERSTVERMTETMSLRGPDAGGVCGSAAPPPSVIDVLPSLTLKVVSSQWRRSKIMKQSPA